MPEKKIEDPKNLSDKGLLAAHHYVHVVFKMTQSGAVGWGLFADFQAIFDYHSKIVQEMEKRGFIHIFQDKGLDELDTQKSAKSVLDDSFLKLAKWDVSHPKTLTWLEASAFITKFLKDGSVLELGCSGGGLLESLAFSGFVVTGVDSDEKAVDVAHLRGLDVTNADALHYLKNQKEGSYDVVCSSHFLEHVQDPVEMLLQIEKTAKSQSIHVVPLGKGLCGDHITEWAQSSDLIEWLSKNNLNYYVEQSGDCAVLVKNLDLDPIFGKFESLRPVTLIPDYVSVVGSTVEASNPQDLDVLIRGFERNEGLELQLTKQIRNSGYNGKLEYIYNPEGPHGNYLPLFNNTLQKVSDLEVRKITSPVLKQPEEVKGVLTKPHSCTYCKNPAVVAYVWAEGRAFIPVCEEHREKAIYQINVVSKDKITSIIALPLKDKIKDEGAVKKVFQILKDAVKKVFKSEKEVYWGFTKEVIKTATDRAVEELERAGLFDKDSDYEGMLGRAIEQLLKVFQRQGHSGASAGLVSLLFYKLCKGEVLSPLTVNVEEWEEVGKDVLQNKRCFSTFTTTKDLQKGRAYTLDGIVWVDKDGASYTDINSRVWFDLPGFPPETEYRESVEDDVVKFYITIESVKQLLKIDQPILADEGGEVGEGAITNTVGLIKTGDKAKWVLQLHDVRTLHADLRFEIPSKPGFLAKYTLFIPNRVLDGERYGAAALKAAAPKVLKYLLEAEHLAGNVTPQLIPDPWLYVGRTGVETFAAGEPGGSPNKEGQMLAIDYGTFEALDSFEEHHSATYLLKGNIIKNRILSVVGVKPTELRVEDPELAGVAERVWLFSLLEEKEQSF